MTDSTRLAADQLLTRCPAQFDFADMSALPEAEQPFGQRRAVEALRLALDIPGRGYNLFLLGPSGSSRCWAG